MASLKGDSVILPAERNLCRHWDAEAGQSEPSGYNCKCACYAHSKRCAIFHLRMLLRLNQMFLKENDGMTGENRFKVLPVVAC